MSSSVVEPYNAVLATNSTLDTSHCVFLADNEALYGICSSRMDIPSPTYCHLNRLLAHTVGSITASLRFKGSLNTDFTDFQNNLVPFPKIHFPIMSYAPIGCSSKGLFLNVDVSEITRQCFDETNRLMKCPAEYGQYISCCLLYRGDVAPKDVNFALSQIKQKKGVQFVQWSPTGFKIGISNNIPPVVEGGDLVPSHRSVCMICNTTAIQEAWATLNLKFNLMLKKKAFVHWYSAEGMCEEEFYEAQENLLALEMEYNSLQE